MTLPSNTLTTPGSWGAQAADGSGLNEEGEVDWHKLNVERKRKAAVFACRAALPAEVALLRQAMRPGFFLLQEHLKLASQGWEMEQQRSVAAGQQRSYRVLEAARGNLLARATEDILHMMTKVPAALQYEHYNRRHRALFFCSLSSFLCFMESMLGRTQLGFVICDCLLTYCSCEL